jgi:hypothetical protein
MFQESENRKKIADASTAIWGRPLRLTVRVNPDVESASQTASAKDAKWSELEKEPMIRTLVDLFQAKRFWIEDKAN